MKKVLSLFATALLLTACSNDDAGSQDKSSGLPIAFNAEQVDYVTRAAGEIMGLEEINDGRHYGLREQGFGIFACYTGKLKYEFTSVTSDFMYNQGVNWLSGRWEYFPLKYWPNEAEDMVSFFAYGPYEENPSGEKCIASIQPVNEQGDPWLIYKLAQEVDNQVDLIYGVNEETGKPWFDLHKLDMATVQSPIKFKFYHALSCIGDVVTLKPAQALLTKLGTYGEVRLDSIVIDYANLTSKARLNLNSTASVPNWKAIVSGDMTATRTVTLKPEPTPVTLDINGKEFTDKGLFYIPLQVVKEAAEAQVTVWYTIKDNEGYEYKGSVSKSFPLDMTNAAVGKKQGIALTLTEDLDLLHQTYIIDGSEALEPSYSRVTK